MCGGESGASNPRSRTYSRSRAWCCTSPPLGMDSQQCTLRQIAQNGTNAAPHVVACHLADLHVHVHVHATEVAGPAAVEQVAERNERGGLAGLARRVQHEVALAADQPQQFLHVHPLQRRNPVVVVRTRRPFGVEEAHGPIMALAAYRSPSGRRRPALWRVQAGGGAGEIGGDGTAAGQTFDGDMSILRAGLGIVCVRWWRRMDGC